MLRLRMPRYRWHLGVLKHLTAYSCRAKAFVFQHTSILVRPRIPSITGVYGGAAGYCPRVRCIYFTTPFIAIAKPKPDTSQHRRFGQIHKPKPLLSIHIGIVSCPT